MTTLPQTSPVRVPQAVPPAAPQVAYVPNAGAPAAATPLSGADVMRIIRVNLWLIIILGILGAAAGFFAHTLWVKYWPWYTATGLLQVRTVFPKASLGNQPDKELTDPRVIAVLKTQAQLLQTDALFSRVLQKEGPLRETDWFKRYVSGGVAGAGKVDPSAAKEYLKDYFRAVPPTESELLTIYFTWYNPRDCKVIMEEIVNEHLEQQRQLADNLLAEQTKGLNVMNQSYNRLIDVLQRHVVDLRSGLGKSGMDPIGRFSVMEAKLKALIETELKLSSNHNEAKAAFERASAQNKDGQILPEVDKALDMDPIVQSLNRDLTGYEIQRETLTDRLPQHPDMIRVNKMIDIARQKLDEQRQTLRIRYTSQILSTLETATLNSGNDLKAVQDQVETLRTDYAELSGQMADLLVGTEKLKALREMQQEVNAKLLDMQTTLNPENQMRIYWAAHPEIPDMPVWPKLWAMLPLGAALGLGLAVGIAFLREYLDDTVRSPRDLVRMGQLNLLGMIADSDDDPHLADARLAIFDAPHSITAEQFRQVRTRLQHLAGLDAIRSILVTGPGPLDGKTTVAANLAAGLALNGRKTLLVDANFRRPEVHRLFGIGNEKGFSEVLNGTVGFDDALKSTRIPNLMLMTSGAKPPNATELFESQLLVDFIERALEEYEHVIFDSAPFLVVSESVAMAARVDGVITVVRAHNESRGVLLRMRDALRQIKAEHLGVVLNAVRSRGGGYYGRNIKTYYTYNNGT
jgi:capsular exopolysaccharide synthesis family protein